MHHHSYPARHRTDHFRWPQDPDCLRRKDCSHCKPILALPWPGRGSCSRNLSGSLNTSLLWHFPLKKIEKKIHNVHYKIKSNEINKKRKSSKEHNGDILFGALAP